MATINFATREITSKIVYFGASGAGCNTNVERLWNLVEARRRSPLHRFGPRDQDERSWYFDFAPVRDPPVEGFQLSWQVYSLPGGIGLEAHRDEVMSEVDAVVFVADARPERNQANVDHLLELEAMLTRLGLELSAVPVVLQVNHRDAGDARPSDEVVFDLNPYDFPVVEAVAKEGTGVLDTHEAIASSVLARVRDTLAGEDAITLTAVHAEGLTDMDVIRRHMETIQARSEAQDTVDEVEEPADGVAEGPEIEVAFQPREFVGSHPVRVGTASLDGDRVRIPLEMQHMGGGETRTLVVMLVNRPSDAPSIAPAPSSQTLSIEAPADRVFDYLREEDEVDAPEAREDMPAVWYGVLGVAGGTMIGLLLAYLLGLTL